jgi:hypothetical protein
VVAIFLLLVLGLGGIAYVLAVKRRRRP